LKTKSTPSGQPKLAFLNGNMVPFSEAKISIMAPGLTFAAAVFEGLRAYWNAEQEQLYVFRLSDHLERLQFSVRVIELENPPSSDELAQQILTSLSVNHCRGDTYIRVQAHVDDWGDMMATGPVGSYVVCRSRERSSAFTNGKHFAVSSWRRNSDDASPPRIKATGNYLNSRLVGLEALRNGFDGGIILNRDGTVSEGPGGCLFVVRYDQLITPPVSAGILESITRQTLLDLARDLGIETVERNLGRTELYLAQEGFYCGTGQEIVPVLSVDRKSLGTGKPGKITRRLQNAYDRIVRCKDEKYQHYLTPVYNK
jgi:branched-chain amino acid aminotransferase